MGQKKDLRASSSSEAEFESADERETEDLHEEGEMTGKADEEQTRDSSPEQSHRSDRLRDRAKIQPPDRYRYSIANQG